MRKCMTANELLAYNQGYNAGLKAGIDLNIEPMLRQQQADLKDADKYALELERLYEDAKAEIEALKAKDLKKSMAIRSLNTQLKKALQYETYSR